MAHIQWMFEAGNNVLAFSFHLGAALKGILAPGHPEGQECIRGVAWLLPLLNPASTLFFFFFLQVLIPWHSLINICKLISDLESFPGIPDLQQKAIFMKCKSDHVIFLLKGSPGWSPNLLAGFRGPLWTGVYEGLSFSAPSPIAARLVPWIPLCGSLNAPVSCWDFINYIYIYIGLNLTFLVSLANFCLLSTVMIVHLHWPSSCARNCEKCFLCITHPIPRHLWGRYRPRSSFTDEEIEAQRV